MDDVLAAGFFDGLHPGHRRILEGAGRVLTFLNHPLTVLSPADAPRLVMTPAAKIAAIRALGVREVEAIEFTRELAGMSPGEFAEKYVRGARVRCGANWRFGKGAAGDADFLRRLGISVEVVPYAECDGEAVSSTKIRAALESGDVGRANLMLGRRWSVCGREIRGKGLGSQIGYPTVNLELPRGLVELPRGVYEVESSGLRGAANWGRAPTMGEKAWAGNVLEVHFEAPPPRPWPGDREISFVRFVRPEKKFSSIEELRAQIGRDCAFLRAAGDRVETKT